jgi:hypothetical protein
VVVVVVVVRDTERRGESTSKQRKNRASQTHLFEPRRTSGARYQRVATYSVMGGPSCGTAKHTQEEAEEEEEEEEKTISDRYDMKRARFCQGTMHGTGKCPRTLRFLSLFLSRSLLLSLFSLLLSYRVLLRKHRAAKSKVRELKGGKDSEETGEKMKKISTL